MPRYLGTYTYLGNLRLVLGIIKEPRGTGAYIVSRYWLSTVVPWYRSTQVHPVAPTSNFKAVLALATTACPGILRASVQLTLPSLCPSGGLF